MKKYLLSALSVLLLFVSLSPAATLTVLVAASMTDVMRQIKTCYEETASSNTIQYSFASSGALARQIDAGAPADVFISANKKWMDFLQDNVRLISASIVELLGNRLALIAPVSHPLSFFFDSDVSLPTSFSGRLALGDYKSVPAGMYAKEALTHYGWFFLLQSRFVLGDSVRRALLFVERAEVEVGIVYTTDAMSSDRVRTIAIFPESSHRPIRYYATACNATDQEEAATHFLHFLQSAQARAIFESAGFMTLPAN